MPHPNKAAAIDRLLAEVAAARIGTTFNPYAEHGPDDVPDAPAIRLANLRHYLAERANADVLAVGEAAGYRGMRWSGIAFTSERDLARWGPPFRPTSATRKDGWTEISGTVVHRVLGELQAEYRVILWNTVPTHPHLIDQPLTNRHPTVPEVELGAAYVERLLEILQPRLLIAVGRTAASVLGDRALYFRHPAQGGATYFAEGMRRYLTDRR